MVSARVRPNKEMQLMLRCSTCHDHYLVCDVRGQRFILVGGDKTNFAPDWTEIQPVRGMWVIQLAVWLPMQLMHALVASVLLSESPPKTRPTTDTLPRLSRVASVLQSVRGWVRSQTHVQSGLWVWLRPAVGCWEKVPILTSQRGEYRHHVRISVKTPGAPISAHWDEDKN